MLSRTAEGLFWLGRYVERAENLARLLEAARRFDQISPVSEKSGNEWSAVLVAAGCRETFKGTLEMATAAEAIRHLVDDDENPSSIQACFAIARQNARAQRPAITREVWAAADEAWRETQDFGDKSLSPRMVAELLERVMRFSALFRGCVEATMLRNEAYNFVRMGQLIERADATARLLDVKYHVLLPHDREVGGSLDQLQWSHVLRAAGMRTAYRSVYRKPVQADLVIDFLVLNRKCPRSLHYCHDGIVEHLMHLVDDGTQDNGSLSEAIRIRDGFGATSSREIIQRGLHEYLTEMVALTNKMAIGIGSDFGFGVAR